MLESFAPFGINFTTCVFLFAAQINSDSLCATPIYDRVAIFKNKKATEPIVVLDNNVYTKDVIDDCIENDKKYTVTMT